MKLEELEKSFLEKITPEYPEAERTEESFREYQEMIMDEYTSYLSRAEKRKIKVKKFKFSEVVKKQLRSK